MGHLPNLDGLRGIAIIAVVLVHLYSPAFSGGQLGVDLFFVLSGFLITKLAYEERDLTARFSRTDFYLRRIFRILPALSVLLAFLLIGSWTFLSRVGHPLRFEILLSAVSASNLWPVFRGFEVRTALGHTWSLGLEEQFYLVWPFLLAMVPSAFRSSRRFARNVSIVTLVSVLAGRIVAMGMLHYPHWGSLPFFDFDGLAIGCLIAIVVHTDDDHSLSLLPAWPAGLAATIVVVQMFGARFYQPADTYLIETVVVRLSFGYIVLLAIVRPKLWAMRGLRHRALGYLGKLSYSLYLWHGAIFYILGKENMPNLSRIVSIPTKLILSFVAAWMSLKFVERPALRLGRSVRARFSPRNLATDGTFGQPIIS